jgi:hypothetical protein
LMKGKMRNISQLSTASCRPAEAGGGKDERIVGIEGNSADTPM